MILTGKKLDDNIINRFEKLDCLKMNEALLNIILGIQSEKQ